MVFLDFPDLRQPRSNHQFLHMRGATVGWEKGGQFLGRDCRGWRRRQQTATRSQWDVPTRWLQDTCLRRVSSHLEFPLWKLMEGGFERNRLEAETNYLVVAVVKTRDADTSMIQA